MALAETDAAFGIGGDAAGIGSLDQLCKYIRCGFITRDYPIDGAAA